MNSIQFNYCALVRNEAVGTVSGTILSTGNYEICDNNFDDDGDGLIDCAETSSCHPALAPNCAVVGGVTPTEICNNNVDDDGDGYVDCAELLT